MPRACYHRALAVAIALATGAHLAGAKTPDNQSDAAPAPAIVTGTPNFELDVLPVLTSAGCNAGACHGKARGQNGFALSMLGFDPEFDYSSIVEEAHGRRVFPAAPENSLLLRKASLRHAPRRRPALEAGER